jgi:hypothetical protein
VSYQQWVYELSRLGVAVPQIDPVWLHNEFTKGTPPTVIAAHLRAVLPGMSVSGHSVVGSHLSGQSSGTKIAIYAVCAVVGTVLLNVILSGGPSRDVPASQVATNQPAQSPLESKAVPESPFKSAIGSLNNGTTVYLAYPDKETPEPYFYIVDASMRDEDGRRTMAVIYSEGAGNVRYINRDNFISSPWALEGRFLVRRDGLK